MAKLVTKFKYLNPNRDTNIGGYVKYIATREGVEKIDDTKRLSPATGKQQQFIEKILRDFPDTKEMLEYEDYQKDKTIGNASEFITRAVEDNAHEVMNTKTYSDYIATRPRAERFGTHGLFTDDGIEVKLNEVSQALNLHGGNVWTAIVSLRREDAERLGFNTGIRWRDMLRTQTQALASNLKIPMENLRWYAAFHNESHHPHIHLLAYSVIENEGYLTKQGVHNLRSSFAKDIFAQDLLCTYEKQTEHRDSLRRKSREVIREAVEKINTGIYDNPQLEQQLIKLADRLSRTGGKKVYGYLKADVKAIIDSIVEKLAGDERIAALYDLWHEQREEVLKTYTQEMPKRIPLSQNKEFKSIKNAVIQEALNLSAEKKIIEEMEETGEEKIAEDEAAQEEDTMFCPENEPVEMETSEDETDSGTIYDSDTRPFRYRKKSKKDDTWWSSAYKQARLCLYGTKEIKPDFGQALSLMQKEAERGNGFAMHDMGKMILSGLGCEADEETAQEWFQKAYTAFCAKEKTAKNADYFQYRIGKLYSFGYGVEQDYGKAAQWYEKADGNPFALYSLGVLYHRRQGVEQNEEKAFALFMKAATHSAKPNAYAQYELGKMYQDGIGTAASPGDSAKWYREAYQGFLRIEQNMADDKLYYRLGQMNLTGKGTEVSLPKAGEYFEKAAELDNPNAMFGLGKLYLNPEYDNYDVPKAVDFLLKAAKSGHSQAQYLLGKLFLTGEVVTRNTEYALRWLEESVAQENPYAQYLLGKTLLYGNEDIPPDSRRGVELLEESIRLQNSMAAYALGKVYQEGKAVLQDINKAVSLLMTAAERNNPYAGYLLGKLYYRGEVVPKDVAKALYYLEQSAGQENEFAAYLAGKIYLTEEGTQDVIKAIRHLESAWEKGNHYAGYQLGKLYLYGREVEADQEKASAYLTASAEMGNQYAGQLLHSIRNNRNWSAATGTLRLLHHISRIIQNRIADERKGKEEGIDRKLKRRIDEKKQAHGLRQG